MLPIQKQKASTILKGNCQNYNETPSSYE